MNFANPKVSQLIELAIAEDIGDGDHSSLGSIPANEQGKARLLVKDVGVICGIHLAQHIFKRIFVWGLMLESFLNMCILVARWQKSS